VTSLKLPDEFPCAQHTKRRQPLPETLGGFVVSAHQGKQIIVIRHQMRCRAINRKFDERLIVWVAVETKASLDVAQVLADESESPQHKLYCFLRNLGIAAEHFRRTEDTPIFRLNWATHQQHCPPILAKRQQLAGGRVLIGHSTE